MQVRQKLTEFESTMAFVAGGGLALIMLAFALSAMQGAQAIQDNTRLSIMLLIGAGLFVVGGLAWLFVSRPFQSYDEWKEPLYTGHEGHAEHHEAGTHAESHVEVHTDPGAHVETTEVHEPPSDRELVMLAESLRNEPMAVEAEAAPEVASFLENPYPMNPIPAEPAEPALPVVAEPVAIVAASEPITEDPAVPVAQGKVELAAGPNDDLMLIEGIGPKSAAALNAAGIVRFAQVAGMSPEDLESVVKGAGVRLVGSAETWPRQAQLAADGKMEELAELQLRLKGGHETSGG